MKTIYSSVIALLLVIVAVPFAGKANTIGEKEAVAVSPSQVSVQYAGSADNSVVFRVAFDNPETQKFSLIIKNEEGEIIYQGQFNDAHFSKAVHLLKEEAEMNPTFIIRVGSQRIERTFKVNVNQEQPEEVVVSKQ